ncbi:MAG TPA: DUF418 domain-containing protein [Bryobacteraceae bacterium]|nr:DUF418 domain-containing protein [Bryobacteraceae bacterium]
MTAVTAAPVAPSERIQVLDILRAFALFGILVMNMPGFYGTWWTTTRAEDIWTSWYDRTALFIMSSFFDGKFNSLFSFLFGIEFSIQLARLKQRSSSPIAVYLRRLVVLFAFGAAHAILLWSGDVLHVYAVLGLFLMAMRNAPDKLLLILVLGVLLTTTAMSTVDVLSHTSSDVSEARKTISRMEQLLNSAYGEGSYAEVVAARTEELRETYSSGDGFGFYLDVFVTMLLGFVVGRRGYLSNLEGSLPLIRRLQRWTMAVGLFSALLFGVGRLFTVPFEPTMWDVVVSTAYAWQRPTLMLFYASTIVLLARTGKWGRRLARIAPAGRIPLTNYLAQSVVCTTVFYGYGLGFYGQCGPALGMLLALLLYSGQIALSAWYLRRFQYGPAEWLWRGITYGQRPPFRRTEDQVRAAEA